MADKKDTGYESSEAFAPTTKKTKNIPTRLEIMESMFSVGSIPLSKYIDEMYKKSTDFTLQKTQIEDLTKAQISFHETELYEVFKHVQVKNKQSIEVKDLSEPAGGEDDVRDFLKYSEMNQEESLAVSDTDKVDEKFKPRDGGYHQRDIIAHTMVRNDPRLLKMRAGGIKKELQKKSNVFTSGYNDWWRKQTIFPKSKPGRNPKI